jgi:hypothetical protein
MLSACAQRMYACNTSYDAVLVQIALAVMPLQSVAAFKRCRLLLLQSVIAACTGMLDTLLLTRFACPQATAATLSESAHGTSSASFTALAIALRGHIIT